MVHRRNIRTDQNNRHQNETHLRATHRPLHLVLGHRNHQGKQSAKILKLLNGTGLDQYEMNAVASTLNFILHNSVMFQVPDTILNKQLVDLGLPKENVQSITKTYKANREKLIEASLERGFRISKGVEVTYSIHEFLGSSQLNDKKGVRFAECSLQYKDENESNQKSTFIICEQQLDDLIYQMQQALSVMKRMQGKESK